MKSVMFAVALALTCTSALAAGPAAGKTQICLDVNGSTLPVVCSVSSNRLDRKDDFCQCPEGQRMDVDICPAGVKAPAENLDLYRARRLAARDGSLQGDRIGDRPICVAPRNP